MSTLKPKDSNITWDLHSNFLNWDGETSFQPLIKLLETKSKSKLMEISFLLPTSRAILKIECDFICLLMQKY